MTRAARVPVDLPVASVKSGVRVQTLAAVFVLGLGLLIYHEMRHVSPIINFRETAS